MSADGSVAFMRALEDRSSDVDLGLEAQRAVTAIHKHCAVFTRGEVARGILDLVGWRDDRNLAGLKLLEPACGEGAFLLPAIERLVKSARAFGRSIDELEDQILAFEFDAETATVARGKIVDVLCLNNVDRGLAERLAASWLHDADFLAAGEVGSFSHVVGNPPYMRWSKLPKLLRERYEKALPADAARGDLCLSFVWKGVQALRPGDGRLAFLCADRWLRCAYGGRARSSLAKRVRVSHHFDVHRAPVFDGTRKVGAYAGITVLDQLPDLGGEVETFDALGPLLDRLSREGGEGATRQQRVLDGSGGAVLAIGNERQALFEALCARGARISEAAIDLRCGMALGVADAFVVDADADIEPSRLVPYVRACDLSDDGRVVAEKRVLDVWTPEGRLVELDAFPRLKAHLEARREELEARACVGHPSQWYRTIDRMRRERLNEPRILVAGMAKRSRVGLLPPGLQPSNALYILATREWPLMALLALLRTGILDVFAKVLAPRFSGGSLRFDGNLLSQVRIPVWSSLTETMRRSLMTLDEVDVMSADTVAALYGLSEPGLVETLRAALAEHEDRS